MNPISPCRCTSLRQNSVMSPTTRPTSSGTTARLSPSPSGASDVRASFRANISRNRSGVGASQYR